MLSIAKSFEFCASHTLFRAEWDVQKNLAVFGKCANPAGHGHNYRLEVIIGGAPDALTGMIIDVGKLQLLVESAILNDVDHKNLNCDVLWLEGIIPTAENLVDTFWRRLEERLKADGLRVRIRKMVLHETSKIFAIREE